LLLERGDRIVICKQSLNVLLRILGVKEGGREIVPEQQDQ
jgi:hypothetical protein